MAEEFIAHYSGKYVEGYERLGFGFHPQFTSEMAASIVVSDDLYAMLFTHTKVKKFTNKELVDATGPSKSRRV
jgi:predicted lactoylglutathione lyase